VARRVRRTDDGVTRPVAGAHAWLALAALLCATATIAWFVAPREALLWRPSHALAEPWRWWSAAFAHWTALHLGANVLGCAVVGAFGAAARVPVHAAVAWLLAWPGTHLALALQPRLAAYGGLSGVLHAGVAIAAWHLLTHERGRQRTIGGAVIAGLVAKLMWERPWAGPARVVPGWDFPIAPFAHTAGAVVGLGCALLAAAVMRARS
jgi:rhomboid family GlyGly-CTERM serine protease